MNDIERRDRLADHEPNIDGHGECFIAIHMYDGNVQTISGIADTVTIKPDHEDYLYWTSMFDANGNGWDVTVHFNSIRIREVNG